VQRGLDLALAGLRLTQDLSRGEGAPLVAAMVGAAAMQAILEGAVQPLLEHPSVTSEQVEATRGALGRLLEAEQTSGTFLPYESAGFVLETVLPELKAPGWEPPGGWPADRPGPRDPHEETKTVSGDPKQDMALTWVAINETSAALESACPVDASMAACVGGLEAHAKAAAERAQRSQLSRYMELLAAKDPNPVLRGWIVDILAGIAVPSHDKYVKKHYTRRAMLAAARLHAAVRLERLAGRGCPQPDDLKKESWTPQLAVPGVEGTLRVEQEQGGLAVRPPETLEQQGGEPFAYRIPCG
jgi:hypothetical protein